MIDALDPRTQRAKRFEHIGVDLRGVRGVLGKPRMLDGGRFTSPPVSVSRILTWTRPSSSRVLVLTHCSRRLYARAVPRAADRVKLLAYRLLDRATTKTPLTPQIPKRVDE